MLRIDHVIYAASDLDAACERLEAEHGLVATGGGRHDGLGTHNRVIGLGGGYLEVLAVADPAEAAASGLGAAVMARIDRAGDGLMGWAVAVEDVAAVAARTGSAVTTISRDGLSARLAGVETAMREPALPFFIQRDPGIPDPGAEGDAGGITWIEVAGDARRLSEWLGEGDLPLRVTPGDPAVLAVGLGQRSLP